MKRFGGHHGVSATEKKAARVVRGILCAMLLVLLGSQAYGGEGKGGRAWVDEFAGRIYDAWKAGEPMPQLSAAYPKATLEKGYAVQKRFVARFAKTEKIGGFKAAVVGSEGQARLGIDGPLTGVVPGSGILHAKDNIVIDLADYPNRHLETEIGYRFNAPISEPIPDVEALRSKIKHVVAMVEVPGGATEEKNPSTAPDTAAWNGNAKALIVGSKKVGLAEADVDALDVTLTRDGETINTAKGGDAAGGQMGTLLKAVNDVVERGYTIRPSHVLTNGALGKVLPAEPGEYVADFGKLGKISFTVKDSGAKAE